MVRIVDYKVRKNSEGETFLALIVQCGLSMVQSKETGLYYATAKKASIPSTFDEETCKSLIGQELEGTVERADCEPYQFINEQTGEVITLDHRWVYIPKGEKAPQYVGAEQEAELV